jgi:signal transduction histidine kinase
MTSRVLNAAPTERGPRAAKPSGHASSGHTSQGGRGRAARPRRLLIVEDDGLIGAILAHAAAQAGFDSVIAGNAQDALDLAAAGRFDLAVLDFGLPDGTGLDVAAALRSRFNLPFLFLSAHADDHLVHRAAELGALGFLVKPVDPGSLGPMLRTAVLRGAEGRKARAAVERTRTIAARRARKREQQRLAAELHDGLGQELAGLSLLAAAMERDMRRSGYAGATEMAQLREQLQQSHNSCRALSHQQYGNAVSGSELGLALRDLAARESRLSTIQCVYRGALRGLRALPDAAGHHLFRIAQEAVSNAVRHSGGSLIVLNLVVRAGTVVLSIRDDGRGICNTCTVPADGIGCRTIRQRAKDLGGSLEIRDAAPSGTEILVTVPLVKRERATRAARRPRSS